MCYSIITSYKFCSFDSIRDFANANMIGAKGLIGNSWPDLDMLPFGWLTDPGNEDGVLLFCLLYAYHDPHIFNQFASSNVLTYRITSVFIFHLSFLYFLPFLLFYVNNFLCEARSCGMKYLSVAYIFIAFY